MTDLPYHEFITSEEVKDLTVGQLVIQLRSIGNMFWEAEQIGVVTGFSENSSGELCVGIHFPDDHVRDFHNLWFREKAIAVIRDPPDTTDEWADEFEFKI